MSQRFSTLLPDLYFRFASREDVPLILKLVRELAEFEKLLDVVVADEETLADQLFGSRRMAEVVIAELKDEPVGYAVFFHSFSTFLGRGGIWLEDLYVRPHVRGQGIGGWLIAFVARIAVDRKCGRFEWAVLDWNTRAIEFYRSLGAMPMDDWTVQRMTGDALLRLGSQDFAARP